MWVEGHEPALEFNTLLHQVGLDPDDVLLIRHQPREPELKPVLPRLVADRPDLWLAWQRVQWSQAERSMVKAKIVAAFVAQEPGRATFGGLSRVLSWETLPIAEYAAFPGNAELIALGMTPPELGQPDPKAFDLEPMAALGDYVGRLVIGWSKPERTWGRRAGNGRYPVIAITLDNRFKPPPPAWHDMVLSWADLQTLPASWKAELTRWRGVYFIYDSARALGYVGSAAGVDNIYGRWLSYAQTGHGGNVRLKASRPEALRFSILQRTSPDLDLQEVVTLETSWKLRLHTREHGLNAN